MSLVRNLLRGAGGAFLPSSLTLSAWYDPSDLTTLFQNSGLTTPVLADGDPVGGILDKSGNGRHLIQATSGARPVYNTSGGLRWLTFDGSDDQLSYTGVTPFQNVVVGVRVDTSTMDSEAGLLTNTSDQGNDIDFAFKRASSTNAWDNSSASNGNGCFGTAIWRNGIATTNAFSNGTDYVFQGSAESAPNTNKRFPTGVRVGQDRNIGGRFYGGRCYGWILVDQTLTSGQRIDLDQWMAAKVGISF